MLRFFLSLFLVISFSAVAVDGEQSQWCAALLLPVRAHLRQNVDELEQTLFSDQDQVALSYQRYLYLDQLDEPAHSDRVGGERVAQAPAELEEQFPGITKALAYVESAGGELRFHPKENFFLEDSGRPVVRFHSSAGLSHEMDHFNRWLLYKKGLLASAPGLDDRTAAKAAESAFFTGAGSLLVESSGMLVSLRNRPQNPDSYGVARDFPSFISQVSYPYLSALKGAAGDLAIARAMGEAADVFRAETALRGFAQRYVRFLKSVQTESLSFWRQRVSQLTHNEKASVGAELVEVFKRGPASAVLLGDLSPAARILCTSLELEDPSWLRETALEQAGQFRFGPEAPLAHTALSEALALP